MIAYLISATLAFATKTPCERLLTHAEAGHPVAWTERSPSEPITGKPLDLGHLLIADRTTTVEGKPFVTLRDLYSGNDRSLSGIVLSHDPSSKAPIVVVTQDGVSVRAFFRHSLHFIGEYKARHLGLQAIENVSISEDTTAIAASDRSGRVAVSSETGQRLAPVHLDIGLRARVLGHIGNDAMIVTDTGGLALVATDGDPASTPREFFPLTDARAFTHLLASHAGKKRAALVAARRLILVDFKKPGDAYAMQEIPDLILDVRFDSSGDFLAFTGTSGSPSFPQVRTAGVVDLRGDRPKVVSHFLLNHEPVQNVQSAMTAVGDGHWVVAVFNPASSREQLYSLRPDVTQEILSVSDSRSRALDSMSLGIRDGQLLISFQTADGRWISRALGAASGEPGKQRPPRQASAENPFAPLAGQITLPHVTKPTLLTFSRAVALGFNPLGPGAPIRRADRLAAAGVPVDHVADDALALSDGAVAVRVAGRVFIGHESRAEVELPTLESKVGLWMLAGPTVESSATLLTVSRNPQDPEQYLVQWFASDGKSLDQATIPTALIIQDAGFVPHFEGPTLLIPTVNPAGFLESYALRPVAP